MTRMYRRRIDQYNPPLKSWNQIMRAGLNGDKRSNRQIIRDILADGFKVTAGYYTTGVRGNHEHVIFWK